MTNFGFDEAVNKVRGWGEVTVRLLVGQQHKPLGPDLHSPYHTPSFAIQDGLMATANELLERPSALNKSTSVLLWPTFVITVLGIDNGMLLLT
jgi:hypothetical protein